jgi:hypothetical protein
MLATGDRTCEREGIGDDQAVGIIMVVTSDVLVDTYRTRQFAIFRPTVIASLPATLEQSSPEDVSCTVTVGTADAQGFIADYSDYRFGPDGRPDDPCGHAQQIAERIVAALPPVPGK